MIELPKEPRFLITRLSAIGDCVHTMPLVSAIRSHFPDAYIAWATQGGGAQVIDGMAGLDEVIRVDRNWLKRPSSVLSMRQRLRSGDFDVSIDPQSLTKSSLLGWLSGARHRIGFAKGQGRELSPLLSSVRISPLSDHVVDRYVELLKPLGIVDPPVGFALPHRQSIQDRMLAWLADHGLSAADENGKPGDGFVLLNPGAGWNSKLWPHERYAKVAAKIYRRHKTKSVVLWAGDQEKQWAREIVAAAPHASVLAPDTTLQELTELCRLAIQFVGSDTGPMHLAAAAGTPCVAMYGPTEIRVCGPYQNENGPRHHPLQTRFQNGTSAQRRGNDNSAMREITVSDVVTACDQILLQTPELKAAS